MMALHDNDLHTGAALCESNLKRVSITNTAITRVIWIVDQDLSVALNIASKKIDIVGNAAETTDSETSKHVLICLKL